ncbi:MAG: helix-turn-helix domain-containing protein [Caldilineaceae bacterium]|nr:helix-turn-helix domain-containing protein [Caldilineaceae bacterium]
MKGTAMESFDEAKIELTSGDSAKVLNVSDRTIRRYVAKGLLAARNQGTGKHARIKVSDLRVFVENYGFSIDEDALAEIAARKK